jgi:hypothetical protein
MYFANLAENLATVTPAAAPEPGKRGALFQKARNRIVNALASSTKVGKSTKLALALLSHVNLLHFAQTGEMEEWAGLDLLAAEAGITSKRTATDHMAELRDNGVIIEIEPGCNKGGKKRAPRYRFNWAWVEAEERDRERRVAEVAERRRNESRQNLAVKSPDRGKILHPTSSRKDSCERKKIPLRASPKGDAAWAGRPFGREVEQIIDTLLPSILGPPSRQEIGRFVAMLVNVYDSEFDEALDILLANRGPQPWRAVKAALCAICMQRGSW